MTILTNYRFKNIVISDNSIGHLKQISNLFDHISCSKNMDNIMISACKIVASFCGIYPGNMKVSFTRDNGDSFPYYPIISVTSSSENNIVYKCGYEDFNSVPEIVKLALIDVIKNNFIFNSNNSKNFRKDDFSPLRKLCPILI